MKKTYIIPELEVVRIQTQQMLAGSPKLSGWEYEGEDVLSRELFNLMGDIPPVTYQEAAQ